jgi:hypothetical protein
LLPVIVGVYVPVLAFRLTEILSVELELPVTVTGLGLKLPLVLGGRLLTLKLTELDPPSAVSETVELPVEPRLTITGAAKIVKSGDGGGGAETTTVRVVE